MILRAGTAGAGKKPARAGNSGLLLPLCRGYKGAEEGMGLIRPDKAGVCPLHPIFLNPSGSPLKREPPELEKSRPAPGTQGCFCRFAAATKARKRGWALLGRIKRAFARFIRFF